MDPPIPSPISTPISTPTASLGLASDPPAQLQAARQAVRKPLQQEREGEARARVFSAAKGRDGKQTKGVALREAEESEKFFSPPHVVVNEARGAGTRPLKVEERRPAQLDDQFDLDEASTPH